MEWAILLGACIISWSLTDHRDELKDIKKSIDRLSELIEQVYLQEKDDDQQ